MLEILAVRLLAPYVGLTLETTTSIIGAVLAGISVGAATGGYFADRTNTRRLIVGLLVGGGLLALLTVPIVRWLGPGARGGGEFAALGITLVALVPVAAVLSAVSPAVAHLQLHNLRASGTVVGRLSAWGTAGALFGTFGTGFVVVPLMPVGSAVLMIGIVLVLAGIALGTTSRLLPAAGVTAAVVATLALSVLSAAANSPCDTETKYHCVIIEADPARPGGYTLVLDNTENSYVDLNDPTHLEFAYSRWIAKAVDATNPPKVPLNAIIVGGGGFTIPRWLNATRPGSYTRVLEVDGDLVEVDEKRLGLRTSPHLQVSVGDARIGILDVAGDSADFIVGDAFTDYAVPWHLATAEWTAEIRRVLKPDGLYALNVIDSQPLDLLRAEAATVLQAFTDVRLVAYVGPFGLPGGGNAVLLASDKPLPNDANSREPGVTTYDRKALESFVGDAQPLRDDYAPTDQLLTKSG